jgi:hypothetical protein
MLVNVRSSLEQMPKESEASAAAFGTSFSVALEKIHEIGSHVKKKPPQRRIYIIKLHFRNILLILPKPINDAPITHDTKLTQECFPGWRAITEVAVVVS